MVENPQDKDAFRTAELVKGGSWAKYFTELGLGFLTQEKYEAIIRSFGDFYGDFHERHLDPLAGPILELGVGTGLSALPLVTRGYTVIGLDNDLEALEMCKGNTRFSPNPDRLSLVAADLYDPDWPNQFVDKGIQGIVSYGVLEHFTEEQLSILLSQHFKVSEKVIAMMPINTPRTLLRYEATGKAEGDIGSNGIFRIFRTGQYWKKNIFEANRCRVVDSRFLSNVNSTGAHDMVVFALEKNPS